MIQRLLLILSLSFFTLISQADVLPSEVKLNFVGPYQVPASMTFIHGNGQYQLDTIVNVPFKNMRFTSKGTMSNNRLITQSFIDTRGGKPYASATFDTQKKVITYGRNKQDHTAPMTALAQDFFTTAWQSTLNKAPLAEKLQTTNGKKVYERPAFKSAGTIDGYVNGQKTTINLYISGEGDDRVELGLAPNHYYLPALIAYYEKGKRYELTLRSYTTN